MERERTRLREKMNAMEKKGGKGANQGPAPMAEDRRVIDPKKLKVGDTVFVKSMNLKGSVMTLPDQKGNLQVRMGILHSQVNISDLELVDDVTIHTPHLNRTGAGRVSVAKSASVSAEINLLGIWDHRHYPVPRFWEIAKEYDLKVILGTDAHRPEKVWDPESEAKALEIVKQHGFTLLETIAL
jgi:DNA mismatch repair protein MutS2